ncbi:DUF1697 domain-containing protein [Aquimarina sp. SS2-1]|uniref:DUF1697 domain-containing protein n=1 Tax=Aquimarina besae TaxID=3342247 RepID=UPI00366C0FE1
MNTYIALLRGINVGGHKKIKMADLKQSFEDLGFSDVLTYIQSGNVIFKDILDDPSVIQTKIKAGIKKQFGFDISVLVITRQILSEVLQNNPFADTLKKSEMDGKKMYFMLLFDQPDPAVVKEFTSISFDPEVFVITKNVIYLYAYNGYGKTKLNSNFFEKKLGCDATARNLSTMSKLLELSFLTL